MEESGNQTVATLRLRVEDRKITEAEWVIARKDAFGPNGQGGALVNPESLIAIPPPERTVPRAARASREAMLAIANSYFDGLTTHDGIDHHARPWMHAHRERDDDDGSRRRGRRRRRGGRSRRASRSRSSRGAGRSSNLANLNVSLVAARRYPIVDEEAADAAVT